MRTSDKIKAIARRVGGTVRSCSVEWFDEMGNEVAQLEAENGLYKQRITFEAAWRIADAQNDYGLAAHILRDLPLTEKAELSDLCHSMCQETCSGGDWRGLRDLWDKAYREALGGE